MIFEHLVMGVFWMSSIKKCHAQAKGPFGYGSDLGQFSKIYNYKRLWVALRLVFQTNLTTQTKEMFGYGGWFVTLKGMQMIINVHKPS
jgi:hypothetical protein